MSTRRGLTRKQVLSVLTNSPDDVSEYDDESSLDADDEFIPTEDESSSSSEDELQDSTGRM